MQITQTDAAPAAIGPYSQAIVAGGLVFCSGQIALDPVSGVVVGDTAAVQAEQALRNLTAVLTASHSSLDQVVKTTIFLADMADFAAVNAIYEKVFGLHRPARSCVAAAGLPRSVLVEIEAIAVTNA